MPDEISGQVRNDSRPAIHAVQAMLTPMPNVRNVIAIASGKGGVGKSTTAVNLALALTREGARVGILDADIYGPSQPRMLGLLNRTLESQDGKTFQPLMAHGLQVSSIGFMIDEEKPLIWRGPMVTQALQQLAFQTNWNDLDYLLVDLPPGTGDAQLTLTQKVPLAGAIIITTPQDVALADARKGLKMFEAVGVPVLGVIENMSTFICPCCDKETEIFGAGGGERLAQESGVTLLGKLPLDARIRAETDAGRPTVVADPDGAVATRYREIARAAVEALSRRPKDQRGKFGTIVVEGKK
jgi:ATP-binding protein involved in chromosome partitioning